MIWLIVANSVVCRIFEYEKKHKLTLIHEFFHPESKEKGIDLTSDGPGHYQTAWSTRGAYSPREQPKENEVEHFAHSIAKALDKAKAVNAFQELIFAIPPHMNGLITKYADEQVKKSISHSIVKDYTHLKENEILISLDKDIE